MASKDKVAVTFAYPYPRDAAKPKHQPDETADLPEAEARQLIRDGLARPATTTSKKES